jgi:uncharacterized protein (TIGR03067 family)
MLRAILPLVLLSLAFAPAPLPKSRPAQQRSNDLARLQGEWVAVRERIGDLDCPVDGHVMTISGRTLRHVIRGKVTATWTINPDPRRAPPRMNERSQDGYLLLSIYRLEGDTLTVSWQNENDAAGWPVDFKGGTGIRVTCFRRKR